MKMPIKQLAAFLLLFLMGAGASATSDETWLHIKVEENGPDGETVRVNLPFSLIEALLPLIDTELSDGGIVTISGGRMRIGCDDLAGIDLRELMKAVRGAEDAEYITVEDRDETVRVAKVGDRLIIRVEDQHERVNINLRLELVEALLSGEPDELDLLGMVRALRLQGEGDLVSVVSDDERVRIWIDSQSSSQ